MPQSNTSQSPSLAKGRVLVVDDDQYVRVIVNQILSRKGWTIVEAKNFDEAVALILPNPNAFAALVFDVEMPGMSAEEAIQTIRAAGCRSGILMASGMNASPRIDALVKLTGGEFLAKPYQLNTLARLVEQTAADSR
jgi:DNA-binding NtrC family response regulator